MQAAVAETTSSLPDTATMLKAHLDGHAGQPDPRDGPSIDVLKRLDASDVITLVDALAYPSGSVFNIHLYRLWIELHSGAAPTAFAIWYNLGTQYNAYGDVNNSIISYKNALALKPDLYQATLNLGLAYEAIGDIDGALATWRKALQPDQARVALLNHCGRVLENQKLLDEAGRNYTASLLLAHLRRELTGRRARGDGRGHARAYAACGFRRHGRTGPGQRVLDRGEAPSGARVSEWRIRLRP